jgi:hypothetical protein
MGPDDRLGLADVPFPEGRDASLVRTEEIGESKALKLLMMRWHPDKFNQRFLSLLAEDEAGAIQERVTEVFQRVQAAKAFRLTAEAPAGSSAAR